MCSFSVVCPVSTSALGASVQRMPAVSRPAYRFHPSQAGYRDWARALLASLPG
jgi:lysophospholipase L1-like esterase